MASRAETAAAAAHAAEHVDHLCLVPAELKRAPLELHEVSAGYGSLVAVHDASARAEPGHLIALVGPNGSGKSTLLKAIVGSVEVLRGRINIGRPRPQRRGAA